MQADAVDRGDAQLPCHDVLQLPDAVPQALERVQNLLARLQQRPPLLRDGEILLPPLDQADIKAPLQRPDLLTDRALRDRVEVRSAREAGGFDEVAEDLESFDLHPRLGAA